MQQTLNAPLALLGGLSPAQFMRRHWQKRPLLVRGALPDLAGSPISRTALFGLAELEEAPSRLIVRHGRGRAATWQVRQGPFKRRALPPIAQPGWTLLVQGTDRHLPAMHALMQRFAFIPAARLDDVMVSYASPGGGVGPHFDSYDVFLLQVHGRREWRIGRQDDLRLRRDLPLKVLKRFKPEQTWVLEPGDMLYLPPKWAHDGVALDECMTCSIGFRAPSRGELVRELLVRLADAPSAGLFEQIYADPQQAATDAPGAIPARLAKAAQVWLADALSQPGAIGKALGEYLSEPPDCVWFDSPGQPPARGVGAGLTLDPRSRMLYDDGHLFVNGESLAWSTMSPTDGVLLRQLASQRGLSGRELGRLSMKAKRVVGGWLDAGWAHVG
jgi:50S ribosomal protein L16 3-hydroxylase